MLNVAIRAARAAGAIINRAALDVEAVRVSQKQVNDFVTEVDHASEDAIIQTLLTAYPQHGIHAEESGRTHGNPKSDHVWIIDPLDGTTNFIHGFPVFSVSIALEVQGQLEVGVVYDPCRQELFTATRGGGAQLDGRRIRVSNWPGLEGSLIGTGFPYRSNTEWLPRYMPMLQAVMERTAGVRRPGSAALDLCYVAAGRLDGFWEFGLSIWDIAAGTLMIREAGGIVTSLVPGQELAEGGHVLAGSPRVHAALEALLAGHL